VEGGGGSGGHQSGWRRGETPQPDKPSYAPSEWGRRRGEGSSITPFVSRGGTFKVTRDTEASTQGGGNN